MKRSIGVKLFLSFALILSIASAIEIAGFLAIKRQLEDQTIQLLLQDANSAAGYIEVFFRDIEQDHQSITAQYVSDPTAIHSNVESIISFIISRNRYYKSVSLLTPTGRELYKTTRLSPIPSEQLSFEIPTDAFTAALAGNTGLSKVYFLEEPTIPYIDFFTPIINEDKAVVGVIKSQLELDALWEVIAEVKRQETGFAYIVDNDGRLLAHPNTEYVEAGVNVASRTLVHTLLLGEPIKGGLSQHIYTAFDGRQVIGNGINLEQFRWIIVVQQDVAEAFAQVTLIERIFYPTLVATFILLSVVAFIISRNLTKPISQLRTLTEKIEQGDFTVQSNIHTGDEIEDLGNSFNKMARGLAESEEALARDREHIAAERNKLEVVIAGISDAVIAVDLSGNIVLFNKAAESLTGYRYDEVMSQYIDELIQLYDGDVKIVLDDYSPKHTPGFEGVVFDKKGLTLKGKHDKTVVVDAISSQITEAESINLGCVLMFHDVTKEKALEDMKLDFVSLAAHELRTPLTAITGYLSVFIDENEKELNLDQLTMVTRASIASQQLVGLVENLLNVSQIERGTVTLQVSPVQWPDTIRMIVADLQSRAKDKSITLIFNEPTEKTPDVYVDKLRITEVVNNLIANAINYTEQKGTVTVWLEQKDDEILTYVKDTGVGIPKEALPNLFKKFFRVSGALEHGSKGTGLGLYISKSIIEMHRGKIWVESELGKGSTFIFSLPTKPYDQGTTH